MKKFWLKFLIVTLGIGMLCPTWLMGSIQSAEAASSTIIVDNTDSGFTSTPTWDLNSNSSGYGGSFYVEKDDSSLADPARTAKWQPTITVAGLYQVYVHWSARDNRGTEVPYVVNYSGGTDTTIIDQTKKADDIDAGSSAVASDWKLLGSYDFVAGTSGNVTLTESAIGRTTADAAKFVHANALPSAPALSAPSNGVVQKSSAVNFVWQPSLDQDDSVLTYDFELYKSSILENNQTDLSSTSISLATLSDGSYTWRTRSFDGESYSIWSEYFSFTLDTSVPAQLPAPTNLASVAGSGEVSLSWNAVVGAHHYNVYYQKFSDADYSAPISVSQTSTKIINLQNGVSYRFIVRAADENNTIGVVSENAWLEATPVAPKVVLAVAIQTIPAQQTVVSEPTQTQSTVKEEVKTTPEPEVGKIKGEEEKTDEEEKINWTPWIILFILIILAGAATGGYFYWFGRDDEEEIVSKEVIAKSAKPKSSPKSVSKKSKRW